MHLRDRAGCEGLGLEGAVELGDGPAQVGFDGRLGDAGRVGRHRRLQLRQLRSDVLADHVRPQAQHLTELDERRAEFRERAAQPLALGHLEFVRRDDAVDQVLDRLDTGDAGTACRPGREPVVNEDTRDLVQPLAMLDECGCDLGHGKLLCGSDLGRVLRLELRVVRRLSLSTAPASEAGTLGASTLTVRRARVAARSSASRRDGAPFAPDGTGRCASVHTWSSMSWSYRPHAATATAAAAGSTPADRRD